MTNTTIEEMVRGGIPPDTIMQAIKMAAKVDFQITNFEYYELIRQGLTDKTSDQMLKAMQQRSAQGVRPAGVAAASAPAPAWLSTPPAIVSAVPSTRENAPSFLPKIFIGQMEGDLDGFIASEIIKQKLHVSVVVNEDQADFTLVGCSIRTSDYHAGFIYKGKDKNEGNVRLINRQKVMVWAGEGGDRSLLYSNLRRRRAQNCGADSEADEERLYRKTNFLRILLLLAK